MTNYEANLNKPKNSSDFNLMEHLSGFSDITDEDIEHFKLKLNPENQNLFDKIFSPDEKTVYAYLDQLSDDEIEKLKQVALTNNSQLPGIHNIFVKMGYLKFFTGNPRYNLNPED